MSYSLNKNIKVVGDSLVFRLQDGALNLQDTSNKVIALTANLKDPVVAFDVAFDKLSSNTRLAAITKNENSFSIYVTDTFKAAGFDWHSFNSNSSLWITKPFADTTLNTSYIIIDFKGIAVAAGSNKYYYCDNEIWQQYSIPEAASSIDEMIFGTVYNKDGVFLYYTIDNSKVLMFQSFIDPQYKKTSTYRYDISNNVINFIFALTDHSGSSVLFAIGDKEGYLFTDPRSARQTALVPEVDFLIYDFNAYLTTEGSSLFISENQDQEYSEDKKDHCNLKYIGSTYPRLKLCIALK